jgi:hypothetical protein
MDSQVDRVHADSPSSLALILVASGAACRMRGVIVETD